MSNITKVWFVSCPDTGYWGTDGYVMYKDGFQCDGKYWQERPYVREGFEKVSEQALPNHYVDYIKKKFSGLNLEESPAEGAVKHDGDKPRYDLLPPELLQAVAEILAFGAEKYAPRNWEKGMNWGRVFAALQRHLWQWFNPLCSDLDEETGKSHLWHAACCLAFLITYEVRGIGTDDRPKDHNPPVGN